MLNLIELEQLIAFADHGTLSKAAEVLHISQPTITRTMKHVEDAFGVPLFVRGKNKIAFNETGLKAVEYARKLIDESRQAVKSVQDFDRNLHTINVESCAPAPLWSLLPAISSRHPEKTVSSKLSSIPDVIQNVSSGQADVGILPYASPDKTLCDIPFIEEHLSVCVPKGHALAGYDALSLSQLNGFNCLLRDQIGFWTDFCIQNMPASRFLIQTNTFELEELIRTSTLLCFTTNLSQPDKSLFENRKIIPITDAQANVKYHIIYKNG